MRAPPRARLSKEQDEAQQSARDAIVVDALSAILALLDDLPDIPKTREIRARVDTYWRTLDRWATVTPPATQRTALSELVVELHARTIDTHRRHRISAPSRLSGPLSAPRTTALRYDPLSSSGISESFGEFSGASAPTDGIAARSASISPVSRRDRGG